MKKNISDKLLMAVGVLFLAVVLVPSSAWAAEGNIFNIISAKMISTIQDVRKIVYVIAGFGLIMFAVLAIFNKISFKHLAYIMIGLSLLAVMMPFINYFSGANLQDQEYSYGNFIAGGDASITGSDASDANKVTCSGESCPTGSGSENSDEIIKAEMGGVTDGIVGDDFMKGVDGVEDVGLGVELPKTTGWDANGCRVVNGKQECCEGKIKDGACKKSFGQTLKDIADIGRTVVTAGQGAVNAVDYGMSTVDSVKDGIDNVGDIISGDGKFVDKIGDLASSIGSSIDRIGSGADASLGSLGGAIDNAAAAGDKIKGDSSVSDTVEDSGVPDAIDSTQDVIKDAQGEGSDITNSTQDIYGSYKGMEGVADRVGDWFGKN